MQKSKVIIAGAVLIVLIIIASFSAMSIVQSRTVADVEKSQTEEVKADSVSVKWKRVSSADGYYIYKSLSGSNEFEKAATVKGEKTNTFTVDKLEQATAYDFFVTAYKDTEGKDYDVESKNHTVITACTPPAKQSVSKLESAEEGVLAAEWEINPKAEGYEFQYVKGDGSSFEEAVTEDIKDKAKANFKVEKLEPKATYAVRARSYISFNNERLNGEWSKTLTVKIAEKLAVSNTVDPKKPMVALTFDDGPGYNDASDRILDVLEKYNARATFFMLGQNSLDHPKNLKRKVALGCELGNHTYNHNHYGSNVTKEDIKKASDAIAKVSGQAPTCFRSPGGNTTELIRNECKAENMPLYYWSLDTQDWKYRDSAHVYNAVMKHVEDGDIILMHEIYGSTADAVEKIVPALIKQGYQLVTCQELIYAKTGKMPEAGTQYLNATTVKNETS
ncbi:MAG: polysaccharide deacetylase family protein [Eubacterium sp.]|nr:polysaccharide deacetylase family protein [Eubacterium sp.]